MRAQRTIIGVLKGLGESSLQIRTSFILDRDRPCGLVITVPDYRSRNPGSIPSATGFYEK
jgi:hypothetical protein